jgi:hypothetical protein
MQFLKCHFEQNDVLQYLCSIARPESFLDSGNYQAPYDPDPTDPAGLPPFEKGGLRGINRQT